MSQKPRTIAYLRVSTLDQDLEKNKYEILKLANDKNFGQVEFIEEKISGTVSWKKRKIGEILQELSKGDNIILSELSRLGRSMLECMEILSIITRNGINIYTINDKFVLDGSLQSNIMAMVLSMASEIERQLISQRTKEALKARKQAGLPMGRPKGPGKSKLDKDKDKIFEFLKLKVPKKVIAEMYNTTESNFHKWLKKLELKNENQGGKN
jgi:DNA invertase Pin-like site-specific DNA recombinase